MMALLTEYTNIFDFGQVHVYARVAPVPHSDGVFFKGIPVMHAFYARLTTEQRGHGCILWFNSALSYNSHGSPQLSVSAFKTTGIQSVYNV